MSAALGASSYWRATCGSPRGESAIFCEFEPALAAGGGAAQHLARLMGRSRALEVILSADDYDAELAERYGWIATPKLLNFLGKQGIPWDVFRTGRKPISEAHSRHNTPIFAKNIERHALRRK